MKIAITIFLAFTTHWSLSQKKFQWGAAPQGVSMEYISLNPIAGGGVFAISDNSQLNEKRREWKFIDGVGNITRDYDNLVRNDGDYRLMRYSEEGQLLWFHSWRDDFVQINTSTTGIDGTIYISVFIEYYDDNDEGEFGIVQNPQSSNGYDTYPVGQAIIQMSKDGKIEKVIPIAGQNEETDLEISNIVVYNGNQFLLAGNIDDGNLTPEFTFENADRGGDFVMLVDDNGKAIWADLVFQRKGSGSMDGKNLSTAPDGTIYLGAPYAEGAIFSNGHQILAPTIYQTKNYSNSKDVYVVSYSPKGKINWVKTSDSRSQFQGLSASNKGVYVVHRVQEPRSFGENIDTIGHYNVILTHLSEKGKTDWNLVTQISSVGGMAVDKDQNLIAAGMLNKSGPNYLKKAKLGRFELNERDELFVLQLSSKGQITKAWSADLMASRNSAQLLAITDKQEIVITAEAWHSLPLDLNITYKELPKVEVYGGCALLGKIVF